MTNSGSLVVEVRNLHKVFGTSNTRTLKVIPAICRAAACRLKPSSSSNWSLRTSRLPLPDRPGDNADTAAPVQRAPRAACYLRATACGYSPRSPNIEEGKQGTRNRFTPARSLLRFRSGNFTLSERRNKSAKTCSRSVRRPRWLRHALTTPMPTPFAVTRLPIQHATQSQATRHAAKTPARMFMLDREMFIASRPFASPRRRIFAR